MQYSPKNKKNATKDQGLRSRYFPLLDKLGTKLKKKLSLKSHVNVKLMPLISVIFLKLSPL